MSRHAHNIVSGTVTNRRDVVPFRVTARKIVKRTLIVAVALFVAFTALGFILMATGHGS